MDSPNSPNFTDSTDTFIEKIKSEKGKQYAKEYREKKKNEIKEL